MGNKMDKKGQTEMIVVILVSVIIGVIALSVVFSFIRDNALDMQDVTEEAITLDANYIGTTLYDQLQAYPAIMNASGKTMGTTICNATLATGRIACSSVNASTTSITANYTYMPDGYLSGTSRTMVSTIPILFAVAILVFVAGYIYLKR